MINRYRWQRLRARAKGMRTAFLILALGGLCFVVGSALSFKLIILPVLESVERLANESLSTAVSSQNMEEARHFVGGILLFLGFYLIYLGLRGVIIQFVETVTGQKGEVMDVYKRRRDLSQGPRIVAIGGGTGLSTLLRGLKKHSSNITAIVTVTDDGGSSGRLTREKGMIPPGDIRNCLVALADAEKAMTDLFQHRFKSDSGTLSGHSIGNLLIAALVDQSQGDFEKAVEKASDVLLIRGRVVPSTLSHVRLRALMEDGTELCGETKIAATGKRIRRIYLDPEDVVAHPGAVEAIRAADLICIGPGSVYTSIIPNLLVPGIAEALMESHAPKAYICNVMTQPGESDAFTAAEHVTVIRANTDHKVFDYVLVNMALPSSHLVEKYRESGQFVVEADMDRIRAMGYKAIGGDFMSETDFVRHDPMRVAERLMSLLTR
ncbi:MAG: YvcK family protein [Fimbriimonadaceae bacterium]|nr:YvcK family protein [Fimbriimonadaceae bacterium]